MQYLPEQLSEADIRKIVEDTINKVGAASMKDMGKIIDVILKHRGRADNNMVSSYVKELLQKNS